MITFIDPLEVGVVCGILGPKVGGPLGPYSGLWPMRGAYFMSGASNSVARGKCPGPRGRVGTLVTWFKDMYAA